MPHPSVRGNERACTNRAREHRRTAMHGRTAGAGSQHLGRVPMKTTALLWLALLLAVSGAGCDAQSRSASGAGQSLSDRDDGGVEDGDDDVDEDADEDADEAADEDEDTDEDADE